MEVKDGKNNPKGVYSDHCLENRGSSCQQQLWIISLYIMVCRNIYVLVSVGAQYIQDRLLQMIVRIHLVFRQGIKNRPSSAAYERWQSVKLLLVIPLVSGSTNFEPLEPGPCIVALERLGRARPLHVAIPGFRHQCKTASSKTRLDSNRYTCTILTKRSGDNRQENITGNTIYYKQMRVLSYSFCFLPVDRLWKKCHNYDCNYVRDSK